MTATEAALGLAVAAAALALTWYGVARALPRADRLPARAVTALSATLLFVGPLVALVAAALGAVAAGWLTGLGAVTVLAWFFCTMAVGLLVAVWFARTRAIPVLTETAGVDVPETVVAALNTGSLVGGVLSALGFVGLAVTELTTRPEEVGQVARALPQNPVILLGFLVGAPLFCLAYGGLVALYLRVTVIKPESA
jgi:hypothetical protein